MNILATVPNVLDMTPEAGVDRDKDSLILVDADYLCYLIGAISQDKRQDQDIQDQEFVCIDTEKDSWVWADPIELVHWKVDNELDKLKDRFFSDNIEVWLTPHVGNFRYDIAVSKPYKSARNSVKPYHYKTVRQYMMDEHGAEVALGCEADDMVCTRQMDSFLTGSADSVIVGPDKDLQNMFGLHYDPRKDIEKWLTWEQSATHFYTQMITGDSVDSIPGLPGRGIKHVEHLLSLANGDTEVFINMVHESYYEKGYDEPYFLEQGQLLHMRRRVDEMWDFDYDWEYGYQL